MSTHPSRFIDLAPHMRQRFVYRIVRASHLLDSLESRMSSFSRPNSWADPWEDLLSQAHERSRPPGGKPLAMVYAQCWSQESYSEAMWRVFSPGADGVRLRSTPSLLFESVALPSGSEAFVGRVRYLGDQELIGVTTKSARDADVGSARQLAQGLLVKRRCFSHEREIRILLVPRGNPALLTGRYLCPVDPALLVSQIMLHPCMSKARIKELRARLARTGFREEVKASLLYAPPPL
jgi:hypothetical protein